MANTGITIFLAVITFNILMYTVIYSANIDPTIEEIGSGSSLTYDINATTNQDLSMTNVRHWYDGFSVSVFGLPWWINIFYVIFQGILIAVSVYAMIRGLN